MHENLIKEIEKITEDIASDLDAYLVGAVFSSAKGENGVVLRVYVDSEGGIDIERITNISRELSMVLDIKDFIQFKYSLEVSSPGVNRVMLKIGDYEKYKGNKVKISLKSKIDGRLNFIGKIVGTDAESITVADEISVKVYNIPFSQVKKGNLQIV